MWNSQIKLRYFWLGGLLLLIVTGIWLSIGRLALFQSSSLIDFGLDPARELYQQNALWLSAGAEVRQEFVSEYPGLSQIDIFLFTREKLDDELTLALHLKESCDSPGDLRRVAVAVAADESNGEVFYPFTFFPIDESTDQKLCFVLEPLLVPGDKKAAGVWASSADVYPAGEAFYEAPLQEVEPRPDDAAEVRLTRSKFKHKIFLPVIYAAQKSLPPSFDVGFQLHYRGRPLDTISVFGARLVEHKPYFWGSPWFYIFLLVIYTIGVFLLMRVNVE